MYSSVTILFCYISINHGFQRELVLRRTNELMLTDSLFSELKNMYVNAAVVKENAYPWIARVIHSQKKLVPFMCTAICIDVKIFITAARCVTMLKIVHTSLIYQGERLTVKALVMPTKESKQLFDDIGFIIVNDEFTGQWQKIEPYNKKRPDKTFEWFKKINFEAYDHKVVGYAMKKGSDATQIWKNNYELTELNVVVSINLCPGIIAVGKINTYQVPCYHSCTLKNHIANDKRCNNYHGTLGGALINIKSKQLFGVATWAETDSRLKYQLPVGFAIPNSDSYFEDYACSIKIRNSYEVNVKAGYYQKLCDNKRKHVDFEMTNNSNMD
ncbi:unnamed protein product [Euphydryas editha]|uniref:Peptidase S1 domain-containing protein n=1 Tax=Euphydryas editha TaxID=104508 RepID=A0AAU9ULJ9_EUPED|nr:unnamed protein product [Euphydryas editha]